MSEKLRRRVREPGCTRCSMSQFVDEPRQICITGVGNDRGSVMVVSKLPDSKKYREIISKELEQAGLDTSDVLFTGATKCLTFEKQASKKDIKACRVFLGREIREAQPDWILALGNEALYSTTGKSGITKYRGKIYKLKGGPKVFPTLSPSMVIRNPRHMPGWQADISFFVNMVQGVGQSKIDVDHTEVNTKEKLRELLNELAVTEVVAYDLETTGFDEFHPQAAIVTMSMTTPRGTWVVPLFHPQSPWRKTWQTILEFIGRYLPYVKKRIAHNGKFDDRWLRQFGVDIYCTFDTMLAAHLINENRSKSLKNLARTMCGAPAWDINTKNLLTTPLSEIVPYNAHDTHWTYELYLILRQQLIDNPRLARLFMHLMMPSSKDLTSAERRGIWVDRERLATNSKIAQDTLQAIEEQLLEWVPEEIPDHININKRTKNQVNFNPSNFARWWLFEYLKLPILKRGKPKEDGSPGWPSMAEDVMLELRDEHPAVPILLERSKWQKFNSTYFNAYNEMIGEDDRIHTTFKLHGTVTGRLSSGKLDAEKLSSRAPIRGVNLQQVPRDPFVRSLFGAPAGWTLVEADFSQVELRIVAFLSRDPTMIRLYQTGQDIHTATASWVMGIPLDSVSKDDRKKAKAVNFGFVYGMGAAKFVYTAFTKYDLRFTQEEAEDMRRAYFEQFNGLPRWHQKQRRLAHKYKRVVSPIGRIRHLPDIDSSDRGVQGEAERQAINSPVQSFASDLTQISMVLINKAFQKQRIKGHTIGTVHDSLLFEVKNSHLNEALPVIKSTMENLPLEKMFGINVDVPILSDVAIGSHWAETEEWSY